jgi:hypothetical protein
LVNYEVMIEAPKSESGVRTLPMDDQLAAALKALPRRQAEEQLAPQRLEHSSGDHHGQSACGGKRIRPWCGHEF